MNAILSDLTSAEFTSIYFISCFSLLSNQVIVSLYKTTLSFWLLKITLNNTIEGIKMENNRNNNTILDKLKDCNASGRLKK